MPSAAPPAADPKILERLAEHDRFAQLRDTLSRLAGLKSIWAGIPMPVEDEDLVIEPSFPNAQQLMQMNLARARAEDDNAESVEVEMVKVRNRFHSTHKCGWIVVYNRDDGKVGWGVHGQAIHHVAIDLRTLGCSVAWGIEQESNALNLLGTLVNHYQMKCYLLTGMFLESSKRSGTTYLFRRLKPTVAIAFPKVGRYAGETKILAALCMHPIGYYASSWAGAMCPTDDVIAHLMLMRGDEPMFWRRCTQHPAWSPLAGL